MTANELQAIMVEISKLRGCGLMSQTAYEALWIMLEIERSERLTREKKYR
jgi:hypothetical protein